MRYLFFFCLLISFSAQSQDVQLGPVQKLDKKERISGIFAHDDTGFYVLRTAYRLGSLGDQVIEKYGHNLDQKYSTLLEFERNYTFDQVFSFGNKLWCTYNFRDKSKSKITYYLQEISAKSGKLTGKAKVIDTGKMDAKNARGNINRTESRDSSKTAFLSSDQSIPGFFLQGFAIGKNSRGFNEFNIKVFDDEINELWSKKLKMPYDNEDFSVLRYRVDNDGNFYLLIKVLEDNWKSKRRNRQPYKSYQVIAFTDQGATRKTYDIKIKNRFITDITFAIDDNGNIVCSGFSNDSAKQSIGGAFYFVMNKETEDFIQEGYKDFDTRELALFMKERKAKKGKEISYNYDLDHLILRDDGGVILLAEYFDVRTYTTTTGNGGTSTRTVYVNGDVMIVNINPEGQIEWVKKLEKDQQGSTPRYSSYDFAIVDDKIHFLYNRYIGRRTDIQLTFIDSKGLMGGKDLFNAKKEKVLLLPAGCRQISDTEMIIYGEWRRSFQFGKVKF